MNKRFLRLTIITLTLISSFSFVLLPGSAKALSGSEFQAGRIMDDGVFFNSGGMNTQQIQEFLNAKVPSCDTNGEILRYDSTYGDTVTRAVYSQRRGVSTPFICLKNFRQDTVAKSAEANLCNGYGIANQSAAEIIYGVSQSCGVSPKVLIVLLQKEQSLVTDDWPWPVQYRSATGYGCPDTAPCDAQYYGFFNQVYSAARQFKRYANNSNLFNYRANTTSYIQYNPNAGCGGTNVHIQNQATAGLYNYTPYQPNASALANLYGTGDSCGAYGNRNFWRMYNDWFGSTFVQTLAWSLKAQASFTDDTKIAYRNLSSLAPGERAYVSFVVQNNGNATWSNTGPNPINVGTLRELGRYSDFFDDTWLGPNRPARMKEVSVAPGQTATFDFWMKAPLNRSGNIKEYFGLVQEGVSWFPDIGLYFDTTVQAANYAWQLTGQYAATDETKTVGRSLINLEAGERVYVWLTARNTGNVTWRNTGINPVDLGITRPMDRHSPFFDDSWLGPNRPARMKEAVVAPNQIATFEFWMKAPGNPSGTIYEYFNLVSEGASWMNDIGLNFFTTVKTPNLTWQPLTQYAYSDASKTNLIGLNNISPGQTVLVGFTAKNNSNLTWRNTGYYPVRVGTTIPRERHSIFCPAGWLGCNRPVTMQDAVVAPGQTATFEFLYKAPNIPGTYREYFSLLAEGLGWMNDPGLNFHTIVVAP